MAVMDETNRRRTWAQWMRQFPHMVPDVNKADLRAVVNALDDWIDQNGATVNAALPQPFRSVATVEQKAFALAAVAMRRAGVFRAEED